MNRSDRRLLGACLATGLLALAFFGFFAARAFLQVADEHAAIYETHVEHEEH